MPRRGGGGGGGSGRIAPPIVRPPPISRPPPARSAPSTPYRGYSSSPGYGNRGVGIGGTIAGSFLGSALGSVLGNAISHKMYDGRNPDTGAYEDTSQPDSNPCKNELDYFIDCSKYSGNQDYCKSSSDNLKKCAERNKAYFEDTKE